MPNNFAYTTGVPNSPNSPSVDVVPMQQNTNSINSLIAIDHVGFNTNKSGIHQQVTMPAVTVAPGLGDGNTVLYSKLNNGINAVWVKDALQNAPLNGPASPNTANGYTSLYGGTILQWGTATKSTGGTVTFPITFPVGTCFGVLCTVLENNNNRHFVFVKTISASGFTVASRDSSGNDESNTFFWVAIGI